MKKALQLRGTSVSVGFLQHLHCRFAHEVGLLHSSIIAFQILTYEIAIKMFALNMNRYFGAHVKHPSRSALSWVDSKSTSKLMP